MGAAAAVAATAIGALAATVPAQAATSPSAAPYSEWQTAYSTHGGPSQEFDNITAPAKNDAWAVGDTDTPNKSVTTPVFAHWNGKTWSSVTIKAAAGLFFGPVFFQGAHLAYASSPGNVWFFGENQTTKAFTAVVDNGKGWHRKSLPADFARPLAVLGPQDVWAESTKTCENVKTGCTVLTHWNGRTWSDVHIRGIAPSVSAAGRHAWIMTIDSPPTHLSGEVPSGGPAFLYRTAGPKLAIVATPRHVVIYEDQDAIVAAPDGRVWFTGGAGHELYSWTGRTWVSSAIPEDVCAPGQPKPCYLSNGWGNLSYDGKNGFWDGPRMHYTGSKWINTSAVAEPLTNAVFTEVAAIPGTDRAWAAGLVPRTANSTPTNAIVAVYGASVAAKRAVLVSRDLPAAGLSWVRVRSGGTE